jgi:predicted TIM-barrel fold metal-dependent hydrolase
MIIDHLARPSAAEGPPYAGNAALWGLAENPNVYLKLSTNNLREWNAGAGTVRTFLQTCVDLFGSHRIAWGSNYPASEGTLPELADLARTELAFLPEADREAIFSKTAETLYPALARSAS